MRVWPIGLDDIAECVSIAMDRYDDMSPEEMVSWARARINHERVILLRTANAMICASAQRFFYRPHEVVASVAFICGRKKIHFSEPVALVRSAIEEAKGLGATRFHLGSSTGIDLAPLAKRVGLTHQCLGYEGSI